MTIQLDIPPAVALTDNIPSNEEASEDPYDNYGNYVTERESKLIVVITLSLMVPYFEH